MGSQTFFDQDSELAQRAGQGDANAFEALVRKHQGAIYSFTLHFFRNPDLAEDMAQETFIRAYRFLHTYDPSRRFLTWLYSIARNICIDKHRERARKEQVSIDDLPPNLLKAEGRDNDPLGSLEGAQAREQVRDAVEQLPEKYRTPIILCYMQGLAYQEVSEVLGISLNNTKIRIFRAKKMLAQILDTAEEP